MDILSATILLLLIMDPLGNIPVFLTVLEKVEPRRRRWVLARELLISLVILAVFLLVGRDLLNLFSLGEAAIGIAGGIVLMIIAIRMIFPGDRSWTDEFPDGEPFIVPMAIPFIAGPSVLATLMLLTSREPNRLFDWGLALGLAWLANAIILMAATFLFRFLKQRGLIAMERLMGMILVAVSVQMLLDSLGRYLPSILNHR
ncbi:MarC family protein [Mangrovitalea sediminis]|uniref:MarC family protein n=1 Tax=Mangrovitalea sediminis TaxID=1982043 RepID=UPI000BE55C6D|nr:MarC family protein [Mangrovitalea sediminis]